MPDINVGQFSEALNDKMDRDGNNGTNAALDNLATGSGGDFVIDYQMPTQENDYTWYRLYKSGWIEQGGTLTQSGTATLLKEMLNDAYNLQVHLYHNSTGTIQGAYWYATKTTTGFTLGNFSTSIPVDWEIKGIARNSQGE